jgi:hypothetical protein
VLVRAELKIHIVARTNANPLYLRVAPASCAWTEEITYDEARALGLKREQPSISVVLGQAEGSTVNWDVTGIARRWLAGCPNYGFILEPSEEQHGSVTYFLASREWSEAEESTAEEQRPRLRLEYFDPSVGE